MPFRVEDKTLILPDGRTLSYADNGNTSSTTVILFLHGEFGVGDASRAPKCLLERHAHFIAPSLPGWGKSSPVSCSSSFATTIIQDINALIHHLHPKSSSLKLYVCGHSFGTVTAQILHGASYDLFPLGRSIAGLMLLSPYSPPHCHIEYSRAMPWKEWFMKGPPARFWPSIMPMLARCMFGKNLTSQDWVLTKLVPSLYPLNTEKQMEIYAKWREDYEVEDGKLQAETAAIIVRSVAHTWRGFDHIPAIYHSGWGGVRLNELDSEHSKPPALIVSCKDDPTLPPASAEWLAATYKASKLLTVEGGRLSAFLQIDKLWMDLFDMGSAVS